jgi:hypothetical protein
MLPIKHRTIFKSRWWALAWSAGIIWSAVQFVDTQPGSQDAISTDSDATASAIANALG